MTKQKNKLYSIRFLKKNINNIKKNSSTILKNIVDFDRVFVFLANQYPKLIDSLKDIPVYIVKNEVLDKNGFKHANGGYVPSLKVILIREFSSVFNSSSTVKFLNELNKKLNKQINTEDIVLHEFLHAVSYLSNRLSRFYTNTEEEFVFTSCIPFYRNLGLDDNYIINVVFMAFAINNVISSKQEMMQIFQECKKELNLKIVPWEKDYSPSQYKKFLNLYSDFLTTKVSEVSKKYALKIINNYNTFNNYDEPDYSFKDSGSRFRSLIEGI